MVRFGCSTKRKQNKPWIPSKVQVKTGGWILLTSMGLFFLPTLLVWSFSGCGGALLTGGLKQKREREGEASPGVPTRLLAAALRRELSLTLLPQSEPNLCFSLDSTLYILVSSNAAGQKENVRTSIHLFINFFDICIINATNTIAQEQTGDKNIQMLVLQTQKLLDGVCYQQQPRLLL